MLSRTGSRRAALVTLVRVEGTSYRKPGAKMIVTEGGEAAGAISGGCLENVLRAHALESLDRAAHVVMLDTTSDSDLLFGHGLGCPGKLHFLIEPFPIASLPRSLAARQKSVTDREMRVVVTLLPDDCDSLRMFTLAPGVTSDANDEIEHSMYEIASHAVRTGFVPRDDHSFFVEVIEPPLRLLLIGAGLDVPPFIRVAESCGLAVTQILKSAPAAGVSEGQAAVLIAPPETIDTLAIDSVTAVVVMTHNYLVDLEYLRALLHHAPAYVGVIGARSRFQKLVADLKADGFSDESLLGLHGPAGLDIGAETPAQIALSIVAEVQAIVTGKRDVLMGAQSFSRQ